MLEKGNVFIHIKGGMTRTTFIGLWYAPLSPQDENNILQGSH